MKYIFKPAFSLFAIAAIVTALLSLARSFTLEPIENQRRMVRERTMKEVLADAGEFTRIASAPDLPGNIVAVYRGTAGNETVGYVLELGPDGYSGTISMMIGISDKTETITGLRIMKHTETPGLGAFAAREEFFRKFDNRKLLPLRVVKVPASADDEIEAITGATITTNAITGAVNEAIQWYRTGRRVIQ